jgi:hypothetical protein
VTASEPDRGVIPKGDQPQAKPFAPILFSRLLLRSSLIEHFCTQYRSVQAGTGPVSDGFMHCAASGGADRYRKPVPICTGSMSLLHPVPVGTGRYRPSTGGFMPSAARGLSAAVRAGTGGIGDCAHFYTYPPSPMTTHRGFCTIIYVPISVDHRFS